MGGLHDCRAIANLARKIAKSLISSAACAMIYLLFTFFFTQNVFAESYEDLVKIINTKKIKSISRLLPHLSEDYRSEFTLVMKSRSLQSANALNPRVILSGRDGKLLMAFNGDPMQVGYDKLEIIQFRDQTASFDFYEIQFPELSVMGLPLNSLELPRFSRANPSKCLSCHTSDPRPNWEHYPRWPGVFLGDDDSRNIEEDLPELTVYLTHIENSFAKHPRYSHLVKVREGYDLRVERPSHRNINFTERIYVQNFKRVARLAQSYPLYDAYKYLIVGYIVCSKLLPPFVPDGFPQFSPNLDRFNQIDFRDIFHKRGFFIGDFYSDFRSLDPYFTVPSRLANELVHPFVVDDTDLKSFFTFSSQSNYGIEVPIANIVSCSGLAEKSRDALRGVILPQDEVATNEAARPMALKACMSCHTTYGLPAPHIPFDQRDRLRKHLHRTGYPRGNFLNEILHRISDDASPALRMPPDGGLTTNDKNELANYFRNLKH